ncbi:MAG: S8 family serine peptidase [Clostridia bacterium]|nr:S8 family serine peptidase [Clostridia bacterium]
MSKAIKRLLSAAFCAVFALSFCLFSSAKSTNEYGLGLSVGAEENQSSATLNVKLKNSNGFDVNGVCIDLTVPKGLDLQAAKAGSDGYSVLVDTLAAGEVYENGFVFVSREAAPVSASVNEKDSVLPVILAVFGTLAVIALVAVLIIRKRRAAALMLAVLILLPCAGIFGVHAIGAQDMRSFTLNETVSINGKDYPVLLTVSYLANSAKNSYFDFNVNEDTYLSHVETVTRLTTDISGIATANGSVKAVTYAVKSEATGNTQTGTAQLDGCDWSIEKLALVPGENEVTITAELADGDTQTKTYNLNYDRGDFYQAKADEIREENGERYIENVVNIYFENGVSDKRMDEILSENKLVRIGEINSIFLVQARANVNSLEELEALCEKIQGLDEVTLAQPANVISVEMDSIPSDPWSEPSVYNHSETWNEQVPSGTNWHLEAIEALSAWEYEKYFNSVKVGMIDSTVYVNHEDFTNLIAFARDEDKNANTSITSVHGTHVAGIIGATKNNGKGGSGLLNDITIYSAHYGISGSDDLLVIVEDIVNQLSAQIEFDARVVNLSIGLTRGGDNPYLAKYSDKTLKKYSEPCALAMNRLLDAGKDFVVVQSAGNGTIDTRVGSDTYRSDDAVQNGLFCSIRLDETYEGLSYNDVVQIYNRIIVVGAVRNFSSASKGAKFIMWERSNGGERVDIYAPGYKVFSTIPTAYSTEHPVTGQTINKTKFKYHSMTGTSQAAPIVTAIAAMCFAINPDFTGEQVKNIICDDANSTHTALDYSLIHSESGLDYHPFEGDGKVISMKLCAEAALRTVCGPANYNYFNRTMAQINKLNPIDFTNFEIMQAVLDTIDEDFYKLYEFEQEKVTAKANELIDALYKLEERGEADYTDVEKAKSEAAALDPTHYVDFSGVTTAVNAVVYGKYADEQTQVDLMAKSIRDAIAALVPLAKISSSDMNVTPDNTENVIVIPPDYVGDLAEYLDAGKLTVTHNPNSNGNYSTGSTITLTDENGNVSDKIYTVVTLGDINGDTKADGNDAFIIGLYINGMLSAETAAEAICCDIDFNGIIDEEDFGTLERCGLFDDYISNLYQGADQ